MKTKRIIIWSVVTLFTAIVALTFSDFRASIDIGGHRQVHWDGTRYWSFRVFGKTGGGDFINGRLENKSTVYIVGPISVWSRHS
jgi:hypothetical protein